tara:strand:- start:19 stop:2940 length:2922 start_codon:yes stop_codon:yes gene_type:complete
MYIDQKDILKETDGGLKIILHYYPQAERCVQNTRYKFKKRVTEKTASANLKLMPDGNWVVTDFGEGKSRNGILVCMEEENLSFKDAIQLLAERYGIKEGGTPAEILKPTITDRPAKPEENEKEWYFELNEEFSEMEVRNVLAEHAIPYKGKGSEKVIQFDKVKEVFRRYNFYSLKSYSMVKDRKVIIISATDKYPIFMWDEGDFKKIYQPLSVDKSRRFMYYGERKKDFLHGLSACHKAYEKNYPKGAEEILDEDSGEMIKPTPIKLESIFYVSGGSDGMNLAMIGENVVWGNSETAKLTKDQFKKMSYIAEKVINVPDIDATGLREAHRLSSEHLQLYTVELPAELKLKPDKRGNPSKDVRDYLKHFNAYSFQQLVKTALPYQFWDVIRVKNKMGVWKDSFEVKNTRMYNFLRKNGFFRIELQNEKLGYIYIQIVDNVVKQIKANEVKSYINQFLAGIAAEETLRDTFYRSNQVNEGSLSNLPTIDIDFSDYDKTNQFFFFENKTVQVNAKQIIEYKPGEIQRYVWEDELVKHNFKMQEPQFKITTRTDGTLDIDILKKDCIFLNYLINTSRVFWRKELEEALDEKSPAEAEAYRTRHKFDIAGELLSEEEINEQKQHLINKIYTMGYLLHRYKDPSRPWAVFAMDHRIGDDGESHGGSGKSIAYKAIRHFMKSVTLDGRKNKLTEDQFIYENVTVHTDFILIDDANQFLDFQFFFAPLTGDLTVNPKNNQRFIIPFKDVPKIALTSNFVVRNLDSSTERRLLYAVFSDYYHKNSNNHYREDRTVKDDFGINILMDDFPESDWNDFYNFMLQCCQFYMNHEKIEPPMNNVEQRNLISIMGEAFHSWADVYFSEESGFLDTLVVRNDAFEDFKRNTRAGWTSQKFSKALHAWARYYHWELDPDEFKNGQGRIIRKVEKDGRSISAEMIYIRTKKDVPGDVQPPDTSLRGTTQSPQSGKQTSLLDDIPEDQLPF